MSIATSRPAVAAGIAALLLAFVLPSAVRAQSSQSTVPMAVPVGSSSPSGTIGSGSAGSAGASVPAPIIMIIDVNRAIGESKAFKSIQSQLDAQRQAYQKEFSAKEQQLETDANALRSAPADQVEEKRRELVQRREEIQKDADGRQRAIQQGATDAIDKVKQVLLEVMNGLALERHANLVLDRAAAPLYDKSYEVTTEALARLDQRLTSVQVTVPTAAAASGTSQASTAPAKKK